MKRHIAEQKHPSNLLDNLRHGCLIVAASFYITACGGGNDGGGVKIPDIQTPPANNVQASTYQDALSTIRQKYGLPAVGSAIFYNGELIFEGVEGTRSIDGTDAVDLADQWHLGSITKSMTATVTARLVENGSISWGTTIKDVFPELLSSGNGSYDYVTLEQLLSHHSGMPRNINWSAFVNSTAEIKQQREQVVALALASAPHNNSGEFYYSNLGVVVAGAMLERVTGTDWETLISAELFEPLGIVDAGFGPPSQASGNLLGHRVQGANLVAVSPDSPESDNPAVIGPAGTVHMSLQSLLTYANAHLVGELGESPLLNSSSFSKLHQPVSGSNYAMGWFVQPNSLFHDGSNNLWYAKLAISKDQQLIAISVTNAGGEDANKATDEIINTMLDIFSNN
jgi:CubicO group peptidase (beta-lactamase class C family)